VGGFGLLERLRVWLNAEEGITKSAASKVIEMRFKVFVSSSAVSLFALVVGIVPKTHAAVRMTPKDHDLVV
jgi:hypothetical protein